jgi:hypothetical protein
MNNKYYYRKYRKITKEDLIKGLKYTGLTFYWIFTICLGFIAIKFTFDICAFIPKAIPYLAEKLHLIMADMQTNTTTLTLWFFALIWISIKVLEVMLQLLELVTNAIIKGIKELKQ